MNEIPVNFTFKALPGRESLIPLNEDQIKGLSTDSYICYRYVMAIKSGKLDNDLAELKCGPLCHARWNTTGEAILFLWTRDHGLSGADFETLETLTKFCLDMYFKLYFDISVHNKLEDGPTHILTELRILRTLPDSVKEIVTPYVRTGAWFSHSECCLLALISSQEQKDREFAVQIILKIRGKNEFGDTSVRPRRTPVINLEAVNLQELIDWNSDKLYEPIFTSSLNKAELESCVDNPYQVPLFHIHTQSVERCVKLVTEAAAAVVGPERRDGYIRSKIVHRENMPSFKSKADILKTF